MRRLSQGVLLSILATFVSAAHGQTTLAWEQTKYFKYNIHNVAVAPLAGGSWMVTVVFSVTNPAANDDRWDIQNDAPFKTSPASMSVDITWDGSEFANTGSMGAAPALVGAQLGTGAAMPVRVTSLRTAAGHCLNAGDKCPGVGSDLYRRYYVQKQVTPLPATPTRTVTTGRVAIEGRLVCDETGLFSPFAPLGCPSTRPTIPVTSATANFVFESSTNALRATEPRRRIVDIEKCKSCHDDQQHGDTVVPRLSLHGGNRNQNLDLCVVCHNPNQTDVNYRYYDPASPPADARVYGPETPIDFKTMVHSIHAGGFRKTPFVVVGFGSSVNDFSDVRFPAELRKSCLKCHVVDAASGKGSFELPLKSAVLGTTVSTKSAYLAPGGSTQRSIDFDPRNDLKITPTAAACSSCHDNSEVRRHMVTTGGASFSTTQDKIGTTVKERCASCHGPGKDKDVRKVHELSGSSYD
jgi:OmcA/MtrC family decaheme c-type cytochrome